MMDFTVYGQTEKGHVREENEDVILVGRIMLDFGGTGTSMREDDSELLCNGFLAVVADGMGGHAAGAAAARMTLETLDETFHQMESSSDIRLLTRMLRVAAERANQAVLDAGATRPGCKGMGATLAGVALMGREYVIFHAGDSRVYRLRHGALRLLTEDDSLVALAVRSGRMTPQEARNNPSRHYVTNAVGTDSFELHTEEPQLLRPDDILMISSDGLHDLIDLETMEELLSKMTDSEGRCAALVAEALRRGGPDNISVILIEAREDGIPTQYG